MRALLLAVLLLPAAPAARADDDETPKVQRYLADLRLDDELEDVRRVYPPAQEWPAVEERGGVTRYRIERAFTKSFPPRILYLFVGFKHGRLVEIEAVYDQKKSRAQTVEKLAGEYALVYGEPRRAGDRFWWDDGKTVLRVLPYDIPIQKDGQDAVEWRTAVQVFDKSLSAKSEKSDSAEER